MIGSHASRRGLYFKGFAFPIPFIQDISFDVLDESVEAFDDVPVVRWLRLASGLLRTDGPRSLKTLPESNPAIMVSLTFRAVRPMSMIGSMD